MKDVRVSSAGNAGRLTPMPSMFFIQVSSLTHWWTMCSSGLRALGSGRKRIRSSGTCAHTLRIFKRSVR